MLAPRLKRQQQPVWLVQHKWVVMSTWKWSLEPHGRNASKGILRLRHNQDDFKVNLGWKSFDVYFSLIAPRPDLHPLPRQRTLLPSVQRGSVHPLWGASRVPVVSVHISTKWAGEGKKLLSSHSRGKFWGDPPYTQPHPATTTTTTNPPSKEGDKWGRGREEATRVLRLQWLAGSWSGVSNSSQSYCSSGFRGPAPPDLTWPCMRFLFACFGTQGALGVLPSSALR